MKPLKTITLLLCTLLLVSSCDFFRSLLGKPTSKDLEALRLEVIEREKAQKDSIERAKAAMEEQRLAEEAAAREAQIVGRYFVMAGSFKVHDNAVRLNDLLQQKGYRTTIFNFKNGYEAVAILGTDSIREAYNKMEAVMEEEFCPYDIWVYDSNENLHE